MVKKKDMRIKNKGNLRIAIKNNEKIDTTPKVKLLHLLLKTKT